MFMVQLSQNAALDSAESPSSPYRVPADVTDTLSEAAETSEFCGLLLLLAELHVCVYEINIGRP